jgi:hypothetical protein
VKTWARPTPSTKENHTLRYADSEHLLAHVSIGRYTSSGETTRSIHPRSLFLNSVLQCRGSRGGEYAFHNSGF